MTGQQATWTRRTKWKQGSVLTAAAATHFGLAHKAADATTCVVVISHDCDLANDDLTVEPGLEVVVGRIVTQPNGGLFHGKSPRALNCEMTRGSAPVTVELFSTAKTQIPKAALAAYEPDADFALDGKSLATLRTWLGSRYNRASFADSFVARFSAAKADKKLEKVLEPYGDVVSFVFFDIDPGHNVERAEGDPYTLRVVLVFDPSQDAVLADERAEEAAEKVYAELTARLIDPKSIVLKSCIHISEDDLTVGQARVLSQWRLEYMSLKDADHQIAPPAL